MKLTTSKKIIIKIPLIFLIAGFFTQPILADGKVIWIDVRTSEEFIAGHVAGSTNIPYDEVKDSSHLLPSDKTTEINVYCRSGRRSNIAKTFLIDLGYLNVIDRGGLDNVASEF